MLEPNDAVRSQRLAVFAPDLIVEVTSVCDRACPGCYSPTLRTKEAPELTFLEHPEMYLGAEPLDAVLEELGGVVRTVSLRGGEPSRHPLLAELVAVARLRGLEVIIETHARWVLDDHERTTRWLMAFADPGVSLKVSYDRMHGLKPMELQRVLGRLDGAGVRWSIAITEPTFDAFLKTRAQCHGVPDERIVFQHKVTDHRLLVHPPLGTVDVGGTRKRALTVKAELGA